VCKPHGSQPTAGTHSLAHVAIISPSPLVFPVNNSGSDLVTRLRAGRPGVRIPVRASKFFFKMPRPVLGLTQTHSIDTGAFSRGEKWPGRDADRSHPSSANVKNEYSCPSAPHTFLHNVNRHTFTFILYNTV
jgi:hypothetical protein